MIKFFKLPVLTTAFLLVIVIPLSLSANVCSSLFNNNVSFKTFSEKELKYPKNYSRVNIPTVETQNIIKDLQGNSLLILKKTGASWDSGYTPAPANNQGDPRWMAIIFGVKTAKFFGFHKISEEQMSVPTAATFNSRIEKANKILIDKGLEPIQIRFHETDKEPQTQMDYLNQILLNRSLPIAKEDHYAIHDISYHTSAILLPKKILDRLNTRIKLLISFREKINKTKFSEVEKEILEDVYEKSLQGLVTFIDFGTGNLAPILVWTKSGMNFGGKTYELYDFKDSVLDNLLIKTAKIFNSFQYEIGQQISKRDIQIYRDFERGRLSREQTIALEENAKIESHLNNFISEFKKENHNAFRSLDQIYTTEELVNSVREKINALKNIK